MARSTLSEGVRARLSAAILSRELAPGTRLVEAHLARELGVSRAPVHEALQRLHQTGLVVLKGRGYHVPVFAAKDLRELAQLRVALERLAIRLTAETDPAAVVVLSEIVAKMRELESGRIPDPELLSELDTAFHRRLCELSGNVRLLRAWDEMATQIKLAIVTTNLSFVKQDGFADDHERLANLICDRDVANCEAAIEEHILFGLRHYEDFESDRQVSQNGTDTAGAEIH